MNSPDGRDEPELERLRAHYAKLPADEPGVLVDNAIRAAARQRVARRRLRVWSVAASLAACIGLAAVLVPALMLKVPRSAVVDETELVVVAREKSEGARVDRQAVAERRREVAARQMQSPPPQPSFAETAKPRAPAPLPGAAMDARPDIETLRRELADADRAAWRKRILALDVAGEDALASALLADFRERFDKPPGFTLEDLRKSAGETDE